MDTTFEAPLKAVGSILEDANQYVGIVVIGGTALKLRGIVSRFTRDVDVIALRTTPPGQTRSIGRPDPLPAALVHAVARVARDFGLPPDWLNTGPASQWDTGLPSGFADRVEWRAFGGLEVGLSGRIDLIFLKLYAAADDVGPTSVHYQDLLALRPTEAELQAAAAWVRGQDPSAGFAISLEGVLEHARRDLA